MVHNLEASRTSGTGRTILMTVVNGNSLGELRRTAEKKHQSQKEKLKTIA
jgi:hypothetical protein